MPEYEFECWVEGPFDGIVTAKNKKEAEEEARKYVEREGFQIKDDQLDTYKVK